MPFDPFEPLRKDMRRISGVLSPGRLPTTFSIGGRTFYIMYVSEKEAKGAPGEYVAEVVILDGLAPEGKTVGGISLGLNPREEVARIEWAHLNGQYRRIGLGRAMIEAVERDLKAKGYYLVELNSVPDSIPFWKALGYRPQAEEVPGQALDMAKMLRLERPRTLSDWIQRLGREMP